MTESSEIWWSGHREGPVMLGFTDARSDLGNRLDRVEGAAVRSPQEQQAYLQAVLGPEVSNADMVSMNQVHGNDIALAQVGVQATADALIIDRPGIAAVVRVADCVPIVLADPDRSLAAVVHAGRVGMADGVVERACEALLQRGAQQLQAWLGPRACGSCYEVPETMRAEVSAKVPDSFSTTSWGTPALDVGAGVSSQLRAQGVEVHDLGADVCTIEDDRFWSYRRQGAAAGRFGAVVSLLPRKES